MAATETRLRNLEEFMKEMQEYLPLQDLMYGKTTYTSCTDQITKISKKLV